MTLGGSDPNVAYPLDAPLDLVETFGPMSAMHAALERMGVGMPCGLVARFQGRTASEVESAIEIARLRFPVLQRGVAWLGCRPALVAVDPLRQGQVRTLELPLGLRSELDGPLWRYAVIQDGDDVWLMAVWAHAAADGTSMLRFAETISAAVAHLPVPHFEIRSRRPLSRRSMAGWLMRFLIEHHLSYVRPIEECYSPPRNCLVNDSL